MSGRARSIVLLSFLSSSLLIAAAPPRREPAPKKEPAPARAPARDAAPVPRPPLVITEIMYDPASSESDDVQTEWVEIFNRGDRPVSLRGLQITSGTKGKIHDAKQRYVLPDVTIGAGEHAVIGIGSAASYLASFELPPFAAHCDEAKYAWLTNTGDSVAIRDEKGNIIDEVVYDADAPWPAVNRDGASIQFVPPAGQDPTAANDEANNWVASGAGNSDEFPEHGRGTPGGPAKSDATTQPIVAKHKR